MTLLDDTETQARRKRRQDFGPDYFTDAQLAEKCNVSVRLIKKWRQLKIGPHTGYVGFSPVTTPKSYHDWIAAGGAKGARERRRGSRQNRKR